MIQRPATGFASHVGLSWKRTLSSMRSPLARPRLEQPWSMDHSSDREQVIIPLSSYCSSWRVLTRRIAHARMTGPYGNRGNNESREQTIANGVPSKTSIIQIISNCCSANKKIQSIANVLRLSEVVCLAATRMYTLAVEHKFTKGRKSLNVVAVCLYVACRQKETKNYMLIDFSDLLQVLVLSSSLFLSLLICIGQRFRARTYLSPTRSDVEPSFTSCRPLSLHFSFRRPA